MQDFWKKFNEKYTKVINKTKIGDIQFIWEFCGLPEIINLNNFFSYLEYKLKINLTKKQEDDYNFKISQLRNLLELDFLNSTDEKIIINYLIKSYTLFRDFINQTMFAYVWHTFKHTEITHKYQVYDPDEFYELEFKKLEEKFENLKELTRKIANKSLEFA